MEAMHLLADGSINQCTCAWRRYGVTREPTLNRQMLGLMGKELTLVDDKARRHARRACWLQVET